MPVTGFEQFEVGQKFTSAPRAVTTADIKQFAAQFDFQPQHMDETAAKATLFGSLVASGWHTASLTMRLMLESILEGVSGRGLGIRINDITWSSPVRPDDELHAVSEVMSLRPSRSKPDRGLAVIRTTTHNQRGEAVQEMTGTLLILRSDALLHLGN
ncbi:MaoC family dehydratase [Acidisphaera sp. L21]|uniref:MaoC family dehydratase n=1 Tax=Acidisphaera sp. L21 TaxID=1641851 RepID=UPI00131A96EE|nr:MaoC family dehydratase [Acidisphaera sp. L21]